MNSEVSWSLLRSYKYLLLTNIAPYRGVISESIPPDKAVDEPSDVRNECPHGKSESPDIPNSPVRRASSNGEDDGDG
jgi:hypothetical protein